MKKTPSPRTPLLIHGALHCPFCHCPLTIRDGRGPQEYNCTYCGKQVAKLTEELLIQMGKNLPSETLREWMMEFARSR